MLKIGEFSKLSMLTVKTLRFYEAQRLLMPARVDEWTGYRYYETRQLETAALIKALRQLDFSVEQIRRCLERGGLDEALAEKGRQLERRLEETKRQLSVIHYLSEDRQMKYQAVVKELAACTVYSEERVIANYGEVSQLVLGSAEECLRLNPDIECAKPDYGFCEYLDCEHRDADIRVRYSQAVLKAGVGNKRISFRELPATRAVCIYHKGAYDNLGEAYAYLMEYAEKNGYQPTGCARECYIDGVWNKENVEDWLTELQLPVK